MTEFRCKFCHKLLAMKEIIIGAVNIRCPKCKKDNLFFPSDGDKIDIVMLAKRMEGASENIMKLMEAYYHLQAIKKEYKNRGNNEKS